MERLSEFDRPWRPESWLGVTGAWRLTGVGLVLILMAGVTLLVYQTGGTSTAYLNFILIPVLLGAALMGLWGGLAFGLLAGLLLGPFMPLNVDEGIAQPTLNWVTRAGIYLVLGGFSGWLFSQLRQHATRLLDQAYHNPVTGLPNRESLEQHVRQLMTQAEGSEQPATRVFVISLQMENYADTISALGFAAERPLLTGIAERLQAVAGGPDTLVYHIHDDHFALLLPHRSRQECLATTQEAVEELQAPFEVLGLPVYVGAHAGVSSFPFHEQDDPQSLLTKAWMAMHEASQSGRRYRTYDRRSNDAGRQTVELLGELQSALEGDQIQLHYQPKVTLQRGELCGFEALLRWQHPHRGQVPPDRFIAQAERTGLIHALTLKVLDLAIADLLVLREQGIQAPVSINVSARNFLDPDFAQTIIERIEAAGLPACSLELEFTETALMADPDQVIEALRRLTERGLALSIDDFGTGYSSLAYLRRLPITTLKVDQTFVSHMATQRVDEQITRAAVGLAHDLGLKVVAEGAEDSQTLDMLRELCCDAVQGFGVARPMPFSETLQWARHQTVEPSLRRECALEQDAP
ncbi:diguanylate cyclase/phosphodiesterase [Thioalkalivibrio sp. K90mix]|uniref:putative bifunctional diguanylate cyclase/phosphodiesterase n=1 Tax=Thioalkalivibrio sp. (strain K90mix) TaxID=396595 RepID=UPI0001959C2C|nr:bifunctional diguanylate cyclase/phosphodiesterase [Thioalkalivibrio sp. K90mix]ADC72485.1 diguanylate cyclase/phosphodiesterase [Thioalkalivibrio sp. K90mix]